MATDLSLLPLKAGDHLWRPLPGGGTWHAIFVGQYLLMPNEEGDDTVLAVPPSDVVSALPQSVITIMPAGSKATATAVARLSLQDFASGGGGGLGIDSTDELMVRLYTRRPYGRQICVARALGVIGARVDTTAFEKFPELLPWWAIFDEAQNFQPGLCATRSRAVRYKLTPRGDAPVNASVTQAVLAGGAVVRQGRVVLRGVRLMKALRLTKAAASGWANLGGFVGQTIAANMLDDGNTSTSLATTVGGWAGGFAGGGMGALAVSSLGMETLGVGYVTGGLVVCGSISALGAVAGAGLGFAAKKALESPHPGADHTAEFHDCPLRLLGDAGDVFDLFDATLEFPPEDDCLDEKKDSPEDESKPLNAELDSTLTESSGRKVQERIDSQRLRAVGWYAARA